MSSPRSAARRHRPTMLHAAIIVSLLLSAFGLPWSTVTREADAADLGNGNYSVVASVFGTDLDGLIGKATSQGRKIRPFDRLVALPGCTESSCPWLANDADKTNKYGAQTLCAEDDGLCWVQITSEETGRCTVAPVIDRGPLFVKDNWWADRDERVYDLPKGEPAAEAARDGADLGYGEGMSDAGHDVQDVYTYAAAIDLGAGTWVDLGLDPDQGFSDVKVRLLWQAGASHLNACNANYGNAQTTDSVNLRTGPNTDGEVVEVLPDDYRVSIAGVMQNGFYLVDVDGERGWVHSDFAKPDGGSTGSIIGMITDEVNFRAGPSTSDDVYQEVPEGSIVVITGAPKNDFLPVKYNTKAGWIFSEYIDLGDETPPSGGGGGGDSFKSAYTNDSVNFRTGSSLTSAVIRVIASGTRVDVTGDEVDGFLPVRFSGTDGWIFADYLDLDGAPDPGGGGGGDEGDTAITTDDVNFRKGSSLTAEVIRVLDPGTQVEITGDEVDGFVPVKVSGVSGWIFGAYLMVESGDNETMRVTERLNLRAGPSTADKVLEVMPAGAIVTFTGETENGFLQVIYQGTDGWAYAQYLE